jgi:hypothetical protein
LLSIQDWHELKLWLLVTRAQSILRFHAAFLFFPARHSSVLKKAQLYFHQYLATFLWMTIFWQTFPAELSSEFCGRSLKLQSDRRFAADSKLSRLERGAFRKSGLTSIIFSAFVEAI